MMPLRGGASDVWLAADTALRTAETMEQNATPPPLTATPPPPLTTTLTLMKVGAHA